MLRFSRRKKYHATHLQVRQQYVLTTAALRHNIFLSNYGYCQSFKHINGAEDPNIPKFKIVVVGPKHSGKSSLCQTFLVRYIMIHIRANSIVLVPAF